MRFPLVVHRQQVAVELLVGVGVEVVGPNDQRDVVAEVRVQQDAAEHALFGFEVVWRQAIEDFGTDPRGSAAGVRAKYGGHGNPSLIVRARPPIPRLRNVSGQPHHKGWRRN
jgi:hypothetical protein